MPLNKPMKLFVGALTLWPLVYLFLFVGFIVLSVLFLAARHDAVATGHPAGPLIVFALLFATHLGTIVITLALLAFYIVYLVKTDRVPRDKKTLWGVVLVLGGMLAMPVFFYFYIWPDQWPRIASQGGVATPA